MNMRIRTVSALAVFALAVGLLLPLSAQAPAKKLCCVAGEYKGFQINYAKPNCPRPVKETFTMVVKQTIDCGADLKGTVTDSAGTVSNWTGTLSRAMLRGCCQLEGSFETPGGNPVKFKGTICMKDGKWHAEGTWEEIGSTDPCRGAGTWQMDRT
jgi:hypothetical protein